MADITMCGSQQCGIRAQCYYGTVPMSDYKSWPVFPLTDATRPECGCKFYVEHVPHTRVADKSEVF